MFDPSNDPRHFSASFVQALLEVPFVGTNVDDERAWVLLVEHIEFPGFIIAGVVLARLELLAQPLFGGLPLFVREWLAS